MTIKKILLIGASTGGPGHIEKILKRLPRILNSKIIIAQHMEANLVDSFAHRLNSISPLSVTATHDTLTPLDKDDIYICSHSCTLSEENGKFFLKNIVSDTAGYNPLIDRLFDSAVPLTPRVGLLPVLLTGIGEDGARGLHTLKEAGVETIAESETSAIVYGMPRAARELNAASRILDLDQIIEAICHFDATDV